MADSPPRPTVTLPGSLQVLVGAASLVIVVAGLRMAAALLVPLAIALFVAIASFPALTWLRRQGVPNALAVLLIVLADSVVLGFIGWTLLFSLTQVRDALPSYVARYQELEESLIGLLRRWGADIDAVPYADLVQPERILNLLSTALLGITGIVAASILVLLYLVFILSEAASMPAKLRNAIGNRATKLPHLAPIVEEVQQYLAVKTLISLATGILVGSAAALLGVDFAVFWGLLAFLFNFIPNIGSIVAAIPAVALALVQLGPVSAVVLAGAYLLINIAIGNFLDPTLMGRRLGLSTLVVILSLAFWGWVWGIVGMLLAVPLTMALKITLENSEGLRWIAVLMGPAARPLPEPEAIEDVHPPSVPAEQVRRGARL
jgi:AI-2 transport protein TqsA